MIPVIVVRFVKVRHIEGLFAKSMNLPMVAKDIGIIVDEGADPVDIEGLWVNELGALIVEISDCVYDDWECEEAFAQSQFNYHTDGWTLIAPHVSCVAYRIRVDPNGAICTGDGE